MYRSYYLPVQIAPRDDTHCGACTGWDAVGAVGHMAAVDKEGGAREAIEHIRATVRRNELEEIKQNYSLAQKYLTGLWHAE